MAEMSGHKKSPLDMSSINRAQRGELITVDIAIQSYDKNTISPSLFKKFFFWNDFIIIKIKEYATAP